MGQDRRFGVNAVDALGTLLLLTTTGGGDAVHLSLEVERPGGGRSAVHGFWFDPDNEWYVLTRRRYDRAELLEQRWARTTLCGREWAAMIGGDGGPLFEHDPVAFAPTCRRCLALMDAHFPAPVVDDRLPLLAEVVADTLVEHGYAEVHGVPGDQQVALRSAVRARVRERTGHASRTLVRDSRVVVTCDALYAEHEQEYARLVADALEEAFAPDAQPGRRRRQVPAWVVSWGTWNVD